VFTIGELSRATGTNVSTIRHYERVGLMSSPARTDGNQRRYRDEDRTRLAFITRSRDLGLSIDAIRDMIALAENGPALGSELDRIVDEQLAAVRRKITRLRKLENELDRISKLERSAARDCRVIDVLSEEEPSPQGARR